MWSYNKFQQRNEIEAVPLTLSKMGFRKKLETSIVNKESPE